MSLPVCVELLKIHIGPLGVFLFPVFVQRVLVAEDEVQLVVLATLVWSKHDGVRCTVLKLLLKSKKKKKKRDFFLILKVNKIAFKHLYPPD